MLMASNPVNPAVLYLVRLIFEHLMCLQTFSEIDDDLFNLSEVNQWLANNFGRVIKLYNDAIRIETSELRKGMEKESAIIT